MLNLSLTLPLVLGFHEVCNIPKTRHIKEVTTQLFQAFFWLLLFLLILLSNSNGSWVWHELDFTYTTQPTHSLQKLNISLQVFQMKVYWSQQNMMGSATMRRATTKTSTTTTTTTIIIIALTFNPHIHLSSCMYCLSWTSCPSYSTCLSCTNNNIGSKYLGYKIILTQKMQVPRKVV